MIIQRLVVSAFQANCYIVGDEGTGDAIVIDPGDDAEEILAALNQRGLTCRLIIATHGHLDHIMAVAGVKEATGAPFLMHPQDTPLLEQMPSMAASFLGRRVAPAPSVDHWLVEGETVGLGDMQFKVLYTPGHSWGSVSLYLANLTELPRFVNLNVRGWQGSSVVFSGDALFAGSIGRTDLGGDLPTLTRAIHTQLFSLADDTLVLAGHGEPTTISVEKKTNPFVGEV